MTNNKTDPFELPEITTVADVLICAGCTSGYYKGENCPWHRTPIYLGQGLTIPLVKQKPLKLNLGSNKKKIYGYVNVDLDPSVEPDLIDDVFKLEKVKNNSVDEIFACHVLEHGDYKESRAAMIRWFEVLKPGGILRVAVPDMDKVMAAFLFYKDFTYLRSAFWGSQRSQWDYHKNGWNFDYLKKDLEDVGFSHIRKYDWKTTEFSHVDNYSASYLPHKDFENGVLISLNVEAIKPT